LGFEFLLDFKYHFILQNFVVYHFWIFIIFYYVVIISRFNEPLMAVSANKFVSVSTFSLPDTNICALVVFLSR